jgi:hypothetical protein
MASRLVTIVCCALIVAATVSGEPVRVSLSVAASDSAKAHISSLLSRELRKLGDVDIVDRDVDYEISVVVLQPSPSGYVMSVVVHSPLANVESNPVLKHAVIPVAHFVQSGPLQKVISGVVAELDFSVFEENRKAEKMFRPTPSPSPTK